MAHLVTTADDESFVVVARHIAELLDEGQGQSALTDTPGSAFLQQCEQLIADERFDALLDQFIAQFELLFSKASEGDLEACLDVCVHLLPHLGNAAPASLQKFSEALRANVDSHAEQRISSLAQLFNVAEAPATRYQLLLDAIAFSKASGQITLLAPALRSHAEGWAEEWGLTAPQRQTLFLAIADLFRANKKRVALAKEAYKLTLRALSTMQDAPAAELAGVADLAASVVAEFVKSPDEFQFDLLDSPVVRQLERQPQHAPLLRVLLALMAGDVKGVEASLAADAGLLERLGASAAEVQAKARLMALLTMAAASPEVKFADIQERLGLGSSEEVEEWLVRAMGRKLIEGQMDQPKQTVTVTRATSASFGPAHWARLQKQLAAWKESVQSIKELLKQDGGASFRPLPNGVKA